MISPEEQQLRDRFFNVSLEATLPLQPGPEGSTLVYWDAQNDLVVPTGAKPPSEPGGIDRRLPDAYGASPTEAR
jgi:hypothetical protein